MKNLFFLILFLGINSIYGQEIKPKCLDGNCRNKIGTYIYSDSSIYSGEFTDKMRNGQGKIEYKDGSYYEGTWLLDKRSGTGTYVDSKGNKYEGFWANDKQNGLGTLSDAIGNIYTGSWNDGSLLGNVKIQYKNNDVYEGEYVNGLNGKGTLIYADGTVYKGNWNNNMRFNYGEMIFPFGITYKGNWNANEVDGTGEFYETTTQKLLASGNWKTEKTKDGDLKFVNTEGYLICYYATKDLYYGHTRNGVYNGHGRIVYKNGAYYDGEFSDGKYNGNGHFYNSDKSEYDGEWKDNLKDGYGVLTNADKSVIKGYWSADKYIGAIKTIKRPEISLEPTKCERNQEGDIDMDGFLEVGNCIGGLRDGEWKRVDSKGKILAIYNYNKGINNGSFTRYYTNGKIQSKEFYKDGLLEGFKYYYSENGKISGKIKFTNGIMDSAYYYNIYFVNSNKSDYFLERICVFDSILFNYESFFVFIFNIEDTEYGRYKEFYPSGVLKEEGFSIGHNNEYGKRKAFNEEGVATMDVELESFEEHCIKDYESIKNGWIIKGSKKYVYENGFLVEIIENNGTLNWKGKNLQFHGELEQKYTENGNKATLKIYSVEEFYEKGKETLRQSINFLNNEIESELYLENKEIPSYVKTTYTDKKITLIEGNNYRINVKYIDENFNKENFRQALIKKIEFQNNKNNFQELDFDDVVNTSQLIPFLNNGQFVIEANQRKGGEEFIFKKYILNNCIVDSVFLNSKLLKIIKVDSDGFRKDYVFYSNNNLKSTVKYIEMKVIHHGNLTNEYKYLILDGQIHSYYENGDIQIDGFFKENNLVGKLNYYHPDGTIETFTLDEIYNSKNNTLQNLLHEISRNL